MTKDSASIHTPREKAPTKARPKSKKDVGGSIPPGTLPVERGTAVPPPRTARDVLTDRAVHMAKAELHKGIPLQDFHGQRVVDSVSVRAAVEALAAGEYAINMLDVLERQGLEVTPKVGA